MPRDTSDAGAGPALNIGIYGYTYAGKTRFLFQLLNGWHSQHRLTQVSPGCRVFLDTAERDIKARSGHTLPTTAKIVGISVTVSRDSKSPPWQVTLRDIKGEELAKSIDEMNAALEDGVPRQASDCNTFLFFFDPKSADAPERIDQHYRDELDRAKKFIDYVLRLRQNENLPIVFVETRLDLWENDTGIDARAKQWFRDVNRELASRYKADLKRHYPPCLVDPVSTTIAISSVRGNEVEQVIERLDKLAGEVQRFHEEDRRKSRRRLLAGIGIVALVALLLGLSIYVSPGGGGGEAKNPWDPAEVRKKLDQLEQALEDHPTAGQLSSPEKIKELHGLLLWLTEVLRRMASGAEEQAVYPADLCGRATELWQRASRWLRDKTEAAGSQASPDRLAALAAYLDDLQEPVGADGDLTAAQKNYWGLHRQGVVDLLAAALQKHTGAGSDPMTALLDVRRQIRELEQGARACRVYAPEAQGKLLGELQIAGAFCENRQQTSFYPAKLKVASAQLVCRYGISPNRRRLILQSSLGKSQYLDLQVRMRASSETECVLEPPEAPLDVKLALGQPGSLVLAIYSDAREVWENLYEFRIDLQEEGASLRVLGMPLLRPNPGRAANSPGDPDTALVKHALSWNGYELKVEFSGFPAVPSLFWDALASGSARR